MAKKVLNTNKNTADTIPGAEPPLLTEDIQFVAAKIAIDADIPAAPKSINCRLPNFSMVYTAIHEAMKYSVPLAAARTLDTVPGRPMYCSYMVAA